MSSPLYLTVIGTLALISGISLAWNVTLLGQVRDLPELQERKIVVTALESIRRKGVLVESDPAARTLTVQYVGDDGRTEKRMRVSVGPAIQIQRTYAILRDGVIVETKTEQVDLETLNVGEAIYVVTTPAKNGEALQAANIIVGELLPRQ